MMLDKLLKYKGTVTLKSAFDNLVPIICRCIDKGTVKSETYNNVHNLLKGIIADSIAVLEVESGGRREFIIDEGTGFVDRIPARIDCLDLEDRNYQSFYIPLNIMDDSGFEISDLSPVELGVFVQYILEQLPKYGIDITPLVPNGGVEKLVLDVDREEIAYLSNVDSNLTASTSFPEIACTPESIVDVEIINIEPDKIKTPQYRFEKVGQSWELQFMDILLKGVNDLTGMHYINILLQNPNEGIGVFDLQAMLNPACGQNSVDIGDSGLESPPPSTGDRVSSKSISLKNLNNRLLVLASDRKALEEYEVYEHERIDSEVAIIEAEIDRIRYSRKGNDNPEIKSNRDKVYNCIHRAIKNIENQEMKEYPSNEASLYNFLTLHIETGSICKYTPPVLNPPHWIC